MKTKSHLQTKILKTCISTMLLLLIEAAQAMEVPFWVQNYGDREMLLAATTEPEIQRYLRLNYGPWDRLYRNEPFMSGVGEKPPGANFYPQDMTREEFQACASSRPDLRSPYTMVRRDERDDLVAIPYHQYFHENVRYAAEKLLQAAELGTKQ